MYVPYKSTTLYFEVKEFGGGGGKSWLLCTVRIYSPKKVSFFFRVSDLSVCRENASLVTLLGKCELILFGQVTSLEKIYFFGKVPSPHIERKIEKDPFLQR